MTVLSDRWIKKMATTRAMIKPFVAKQVRKGKISFGLSSYGYDARVSNEFKIFTNVNSGIVDPKVFKKDSFVTKIGKECIIPPNSFALARTMEYFKIPEDVCTVIFFWLFSFDNNSATHLVPLPQAPDTLPSEL